MRDWWRRCRRGSTMRGYAWRTSEDGEVLMLRATALGLARVGEGETGSPTPESIEAEAWETTGVDAGIAVAGLAPLVMDLAACGSEQGQGGPEDANRREEVQGHGDTAQAAVEPPAAVPARGSRHGRLHQTARAFLDAWDARAGNDDDIADPAGWSCRRSSFRAGGERFGGRRD
jgi:hypothetical protein